MLLGFITFDNEYLMSILQNIGKFIALEFNIHMDMYTCLICLQFYISNKFYESKILILIHIIHEQPYPNWQVSPSSSSPKNTAPISWFLFPSSSESYDKATNYANRQHNPNTINSVNIMVAIQRDAATGALAVNYICLMMNVF